MIKSPLLYDVIKSPLFYDVIKSPLLCDVIKSPLFYDVIKSPLFSALAAITMPFSISSTMTSLTLITNTVSSVAYRQPLYDNIMLQSPSSLL